VPYLKADFRLSSSVAGIFGTSANIGRAIGGTLSIGPVDRYGKRRMILLGGATSGVLAILAALSPPAPLTLVLLIASGVAQTVAILAGITAVATWFRTAGRGVAMGIRQAAVPVAGTLAAASLPILALELGWRNALFVAGGTSIVASVLGTAIYRDYGRTDGGLGPLAGRRGAVRAVLRDRDVSGAEFAGAVLAAGQFVTLTYIKLFLIEDLHTSLRFAALVLTLTQVAGVVGRIGWGLLSDLVFGGQRKGVLLVILLLAAGASLGLGLAGDGQSVALALSMALLLGLTTVGSPASTSR
jgi:ACS family hexuronate transporter-like MFS transporter